MFDWKLRRNQMARIANDLTRLREEIRTLHGGRETLLRSLKDAVAGLRASFRNEHAQMARKTKADRLAFVSGMRKEVSRSRNEFSTELADAHKAWFGNVARRYR
jgi:hypothetical protein